MHLSHEDGRPLTDADQYVIRFGQRPPVKAFWLVSLDDRDGFFVANPMNRYAIGDRDPLPINRDGAIDIFIQTERPTTEALNGTWTVPPRRRVRTPNPEPRTSNPEPRT